MKADHDGLLKAVLAKPDDDAPRLVFADWCDENGDPDRAEFVRVQIELAARTSPAWRTAELRRRESEILAAHREDWVGRPFSSRYYADQWVFHRGFVERIEVPFDVPATKIRTLFSQYPIRVVRIGSQVDHLTEWIGALPVLKHLRGFEVFGFYGMHRRADEVRDFLTARQLSGLRSLILAYDRNAPYISDRVTLAVLQAGHRLRELALNFDDTRRGPSTKLISAMANQDRYSGLRRLYLGGPNLDRKTARLIGTSPVLRRLTHLNLMGARFDRPVWEELAASPNVRGLKKLWVTDLWPRPGEKWRGEVLARLREALGEKAIDSESELFGPWEGYFWKGPVWEHAGEDHPDHQP